MGIRYTLRKATQSLSFSNVIPTCGNGWTTVFMIHKRELSDSRVESVSSLFYLLHCSAHDRLNTMTFRSFRNIPHGLHLRQWTQKGGAFMLCLSTSRTDCIPTSMRRGVWTTLCLSTFRTDCIYAKYEQAYVTGLCLSTSRMDCISKIAQMQCHKSTQYAVSW